MSIVIVKEKKSHIFIPHNLIMTQELSPSQITFLMRVLLETEEGTEADEDALYALFEKYLSEKDMKDALQWAINNKLLEMF